MPIEAPAEFRIAAAVIACQTTMNVRPMNLGRKALLVAAEIQRADPATWSQEPRRGADVASSRNSRTETATMDKDRIKGVAEQAKGIAKERAGKMTGDKKLKSEGKVDKTTGKVRNTVGGIKDSLRDR